MISILSIAGAIGLGLIVRQAFFRELALSSRRNLVMILAAIVLVAGGMLTHFSIDRFREMLAISDWPSVEGEVISSKMIGERAFHPEVVYQYRMNDKLYVDTTDLGAPAFGGKRKRHEVAEALLEPFDSGMTVKVFYSPEDPKYSMLRPHITWSVLGKMGFGGTLVMVTTVILLSFRRRKRIA